jgi:hypothetical protein
MKVRLLTLCLVALVSICIPAAALSYIETYSDSEADTNDPTWFTEDQSDQSGGSPINAAGPDYPCCGFSPHECATQANYPHMSTAVSGAASVNGATRCVLTAPSLISAAVTLARYINGVWQPVGDRDGAFSTRSYPSTRVTATSKENPCHQGSYYLNESYGYSISYGRTYAAYAYSPADTPCPY